MMQSILLPIFPLSAVIFPDSKIFLRIFEPRYLKMVSRSIKKSSYFAIIKTREDANYHGVMATYVKVVSWEGDDKGVLSILVEGVGKCKINNYYFEEDNLCMAKVTIFEKQQAIKVPKKYQCLSKFLQELYEKFNSDYQKEYYVYQMDNANWLSYRLGEVINLSNDLKQDILETQDPIHRLEKIYEGIFISDIHFGEENNTIQ